MYMLHVTFNIDFFFVVHLEKTLLSNMHNLITCLTLINTKTSTIMPECQNTLLTTIKASFQIKVLNLE